MPEAKTRVEELYGILHSMPELGLQEVRTAAFLAEQLGKAGCAVTTRAGGTGGIGVLRGEKPGPVLALRHEVLRVPVDLSRRYPALIRRSSIARRGCRW